MATSQGYIICSSRASLCGWACKFREKDKRNDLVFMPKVQQLTHPHLYISSLEINKIKKCLPSGAPRYDVILKFLQLSQSILVESFLQHSLSHGCSRHKFSFRQPIDSLCFMHTFTINALWQWTIYVCAVNITEVQTSLNMKLLLFCLWLLYYSWNFYVCLSHWQTKASPCLCSEHIDSSLIDLISQEGPKGGRGHADYTTRWDGVLGGGLHIFC